MDAHTRDLRVALAVAEELNVTRAAQRLHVSQPAVSKQLAALERALGHPLFERRHRGVVLTPVGRAVLPQLAAVVAAWDAAQAAVRAAAPVAHLVVGLQTAVGRGLQRAALATFAATCPGWTPQLRLVGWEDPSAGLADASSDVAFVWLPLAGDDLDAEVLREEERLVLLPADHRLAGRPDVAVADLLDEPFVALPETAGALRAHWLAGEARDGRPAVVGAVAHGADEAFEAVAAGLGVCLVSAGNAGLYPRPGVVAVPVRGLAPARLAVAWRAGDTRPVVAAFVRAVVAAAEQHLDPARGDGSARRPACR